MPSARLLLALWKQGHPTTCHLRAQPMGPAVRLSATQLFRRAPILLENCRGVQVRQRLVLFFQPFGMRQRLPRNHLSRIAAL